MVIYYSSNEKEGAENGEVGRVIGYGDDDGCGVLPWYRHIIKI